MAKDKHGHKLPEPHAEYKGEIQYHDPNYLKCHNCKGQLKVGSKFTIRFFGTENYDGKEKIQGPLCPNCSELPPEHLPSRNVDERWY